MFDVTPVQDAIASQSSLPNETLRSSLYWAHEGPMDADVLSRQVAHVGPVAADANAPGRLSALAHDVPVRGAVVAGEAVDGIVDALRPVRHAAHAPEMVARERRRGVRTAPLEGRVCTPRDAAAGAAVAAICPVPVLRRRGGRRRIRTVALAWPWSADGVFVPPVAGDAAKVAVEGLLAGCRCRCRAEGRGGQRRKEEAVARSRRGRCWHDGVDWRQEGRD